MDLLRFVCREVWTKYIGEESANRHIVHRHSTDLLHMFEPSQQHTAEWLTKCKDMAHRGPTIKFAHSGCS